MLESKFIVRQVLPLAVVAGMTIVPELARASSTHEFVYHASGKVAGEVWFNSGYSAAHDGRPQFGENTFTVRDQFCGDGWGIGASWILNGKEYSKQATGDCSPVEVTFQANPNQPQAVEFRWRAFKWDTNHRSATTFEPWRSDWMGSDKRCDSIWMGRAATYGLEMTGVGHTFEVSMWPTKTARAVGREDIGRIWSALQRCVALPASLTQSQRDSLYKQLWCHAVFGVTASLGGPTWDFEANRTNISWVKVFIGYKRCNW
jgi:hypothetical protein